MAVLLANIWIVLLAVGAYTAEEQDSMKPLVKFSDIISVIAEKREVVSQHKFFQMLADSTISYSKRMSFIPYWSYFAMTFADLLDSWLYVPDASSDLEKRVNTFVSEDNFHYNLFLHDVEMVLHYTVDQFGSYSAVLRHLWGDESKAVRQLMYTWAACAKKYDDPLITLVTFEAIEAGLKDIFEVTFNEIYMPKNGMKGLKYFGLTHVEFEVNHTQTAWFREGDSPIRPLGQLDVTELQWKHALDVIGKLFNGNVIRHISFNLDN